MPVGVIYPVVPVDLGVLAPESDGQAHALIDPLGIYAERRCIRSANTPSASTLAKLTSGSA